MIYLRVATAQDLEPIMEIINQAKAFLKAQGIDQWQTGYPAVSDIKRDIEEKKGYLIVEDGEYHGYFCADFGGEPAYENIEGAWNYDEPYVVVHRMAFAESSRGKGISAEAFPLIEQLCRDNDVHYFRVDTDRDNKIMQHLLGKAGFVYCGKIWYDGAERIAFDKKLD